AAKAAGQPAPIADARLFRACAELAEIVPEDGLLRYDAIEFALQRNGIIEPSPNLRIVWGDLGDLQQIMDQLRPQISEILSDGATARVGVAAAKRAADGTGAVVFALQGSSLATAPFPRSVAAGGRFAID